MQATAHSFSEIHPGILRKQLQQATTIASASGHLLSVSPVDGDHTALQSIFNDAARSAPATSAPATSGWLLSQARTLASARTALERAMYSIVLCERDLEPGSWRELLQSTQRLAIPPFLIVTSRHADDYLWAEALNLGAYDVLAKPFCPSEVNRVVNLACLRWQRERHPVSRPMVVGTASGM